MNAGEAQESAGPNASGPSNHLFHRGGLSSALAQSSAGMAEGKRTAMKREQEITLGEMRATGATHLLVRCGDYKCAHSHVVDAGRWPDHVRLSDLEPLFICRVCGLRGADVRPLFEPPRMGTNAQKRPAHLRRRP